MSNITSDSPEQLKEKLANAKRTFLPIAVVFGFSLSLGLAESFKAFGYVCDGKVLFGLWALAVLSFGALIYIYLIRIDIRRELDNRDAVYADRYINENR